MNKPQRINETEERDGPSLFNGISYEVDEIILGRNVVSEKCAALREAMTARHAANVKQAADDIARISAQMHTLSAHLAGVIARHQARTPKLPK